MNFGYKQIRAVLLPFGKLFWIPACAGMTVDGPVPSAASRVQALVQDAFRVIPAKARVQNAFRVIPAKAGVQGQKNLQKRL
jgi:hypothetical protein